jgi:flagellar biosynthesis protein
MDKDFPPRVSRAVALAYAEEEKLAGQSPRISARGQGVLASAIIDKAKEHGIPIVESEELVASLIQFDIDQHVPESLYLAVAEILAWAIRCDHEAASAVPDASGSRSNHGVAPATQQTSTPPRGQRR